MIMVRKEIVYEGCRAITTEGRTKSYRGMIQEAFYKTCISICGDQWPLQYHPDNFGKLVQIQEKEIPSSSWFRPCMIYASNAGEPTKNGEYCFAVVGLVDYPNMHEIISIMEEEIEMKEIEGPNLWRERLEKYGEQPPVGYVDDKELIGFIDRYREVIWPPLMDKEKG